MFLIASERSWLEQGRMVGEHVIPLARNFNSIDLESGSSNSTVCPFSINIFSLGILHAIVNYILIPW